MPQGKQVRITYKTQEAYTVTEVEAFRLLTQVCFSRASRSSGSEIIGAPVRFGVSSGGSAQEQNTERV